MPKFVTKAQLSEEIGLSPHTFRRYRERGQWVEGVHYSKVNQNTVRYNLAMCLDWIANRSNPTAHERSIACYLQTLSNHEETTPTARQKRKR